MEHNIILPYIIITVDYNTIELEQPIFWGAYYILHT